MDKENVTVVKSWRRFAITFRFFDVLTVLNEGGQFEKSFREIHGF